MVTEKSVSGTKALPRSGRQSPQALRRPRRQYSQKQAQSSHREQWCHSTVEVALPKLRYTSYQGDQCTLKRVTDLRRQRKQSLRTWQLWSVPATVFSTVHAPTVPHLTTVLGWWKESTTLVRAQRQRPLGPTASITMSSHRQMPGGISCVTVLDFRVTVHKAFTPIAIRWRNKELCESNDRSNDRVTPTQRKKAIM